MTHPTPQPSTAYLVDADPITIRQCESLESYIGALRLLREFASVTGQTRQSLQFGALISRLRHDGAAKGDGCIQVAYCYETPVGCIGLFTNGDGPATLRWLYVKSGYRRQGIGRRLLRAARDYAEARGHDRLIAEIPRQALDGFVFAASAGFEVRPGETIAVAEQHCTLQLMLSDPNPTRLAA